MTAAVPYMLLALSALALVAIVVTGCAQLASARHRYTGTDLREYAEGYAGKMIDLERRGIGDDVS